jgi:hypothetical protein
VSVALHCLLHQLVIAHSHKDIHPEIAKVFNERRSRDFVDGPLTVKESVDLIYVLSGSYDRMFVAIDGLDEYHAPFREALLDALNEIIRVSRSRVSVLVASQDTKDMVSRMLNHPEVHLDELAHSRDIHRYIQTQLHRKIAAKALLGGRVSPGLRTEIESTLITKAGGMYETHSSIDGSTDDHEGSVGFKTQYNI